ncbi:isopeptide-forming domain-containing fimbrial protein [uncultured Lactobacillus sp.]|uniref:isopeptide-forming domain-containing fimbrial protein n=1 Tax=uncultured Lactobacillus sp. TaxID=153152 RepID=UPI00259AF250|nr:isopeptide-forming domain-containing fimbrial protein [uncultured Lactobacillus sp.]
MISLTQKNKVVSLAAAALVATSFGTSALLATGSSTVHADNAEMVGLPKGQNIVGTKMAGQYAFIPKVTQGITKVHAFGGASKDWATSGTNTEGKSHSWYAFSVMGNESQAGKVGVYYSNTGIDPISGKTIDVKVTATDWNIESYKWQEASDGKREKVPLKNPTIAFGVDDFEIFTPGQGAVAYRIDFIDHDTGKPLKLSLNQSVRDIDGNQWVGYDSSTYGKIDQLIYGDPSKDGNTWLSYKNTLGNNYIFSDANKHNTALPDGSGTVTSKDKKAGYTATMSNTDHINMYWVFGTTTGKHAAENQAELEKDTDNWQLNQGKYDANAEKNKVSITNSIWNGTFNHAYLKLFDKPTPKDKPMAPNKYVSDKDEGTNTPSEIGGVKSVTHDMLDNRYEGYHYQITHSVPDVANENKYTEYRITDNLDNLLDIDTGSIRVYNRANQDVTHNFTVTLDAGNNLSVIAKSDVLKMDDFYNETYKVTFDAKVKPGKSLKDHADPKHKDQSVIYNEAKVIQDSGSADSNKVTTNIPFTKEKDEKFVSNDGLGDTKSLKDVDFGKKYTYRVEATVPDNEDITSLAIKDTIEPEVQNIKGVKVYDYDAKDAAGNAKEITDQGKLEVDNKTGKISWTANDPANWHGKHLKMFIDTTLINTPKLLDYLDKDAGNIEVPNTAHFIFNGKDIPSNITHVSPKTPKPSAEKKIEVNDDQTSDVVDPTGDSKKNENTDKDNKHESEGLSNVVSFFLKLFNR